MGLPSMRSSTSATSERIREATARASTGSPTQETDLVRRAEDVRRSRRSAARRGGARSPAGPARRRAGRCWVTQEQVGLEGDGVVNLHPQVGRDDLDRGRGRHPRPVSLRHPGGDADEPVACAEGDGELRCAGVESDDALGPTVEDGRLLDQPLHRDGVRLLEFTERLGALAAGGSRQARPRAAQDREARLHADWHYGEDGALHAG